jgi:polar amino acid transport system substrate-binding protein
MLSLTKLPFAAFVAMAMLSVTPALLAEANEDPQIITLGHEDKDAFPWVLPDGKGGYVGIDLETLKLLEKEMKITIKTSALPWRRCLEEMKLGKVDGAFASSYKQEREEFGRYPLDSSGKVDASRMIHMSGYSLYYSKIFPVTFDGKKFAGIKGRVAAQFSFSIVKPLQELGVDVDDSSGDPVDILKKLTLGRVGAAVLQTARAEKIIGEKEEFRKAIAKSDYEKPPFESKPYFLMLSHQLLEKHPKFSERLWNSLKKVVHSKEYQEREAAFYKSK